MLKQVSEHIHVYPCDGYTDRPNIGLITGDKYTLLYDAGNSEAHVRLIQSCMEKQGLPKADFCCLSHWHWDHSFGAAFWRVPIIAGRETNEQLKVVRKWKWDDLSMDRRVAAREDIVFCNEMIRREYPDRSKIQVVTADIVFDGSLCMDLGGGVVCELIHCKGPHASDSVICYVPGDKFLFLGDSNCRDLYGQEWEFSIEQEEDFPKNADAIPYDRDKVTAYLRLLDTLDFTMCISGHSPEPKSRASLYSDLQEEN